MSPAPVLVWLRDDLRLADNPALDAAARTGRPIVLLHVLDEVSPGLRPLGAAARWWLHHSVGALAESVAARGGRLVLRRGPAEIVVPAVMAESGADTIFWNRRVGGPERAIDAALKAEIRARGETATSFHANLLHEPHRLLTKSGGPFRVFTPFWRAFLAGPAPRAPLPAPARLPAPTVAIDGDDLADWRLRPTAPDWSGGVARTWTPGETGAGERLSAFLNQGIYSYHRERDRPDLDVTSRLSAHLRFGEISPFQVWAAVADAAGREDGPETAALDKFRAELGWREFSHHLLFHLPELHRHNVQPRFDAFPWRADPAFLAAWRAGRTGYPLVDAGMRELWETGTMHNRVRMVAASFLVKHGLIDWREGEAWFWDTLVDACPANNPASWQWVAGSGADAAPYFRIFNPVTQAETFDPEGSYVRRFVPELARLSAPAIHRPWAAPPAVLAAAGVRLGETWPRPIVDHAAARERALAAFAATASG